ncbi:MAG: AAA family ATPase [Candidatus Nitrotoga sp.]
MSLTERASRWPWAEYKQHCKREVLTMGKLSVIENRVANGREFLDGLAAAMQAKTPDFAAPEPISAPEWSNARSTPDCIVQNLLFADVAVFIAAGGMGKTTLKLFEAIHIALGLPLYGLTIFKPGAVLIITAEDSREMLVARLREIAKAMELNDSQIAIVMQRVRISDVSGNGFKVTEVRGDVVIPSTGIYSIIEACKTISPVLIVIDPAVSFGVGESRVNDAEQGLIEAARKLRRALNCCIQYIHHSGKQNARDKAVDQYAGRGGSAFADGARMVHVLQSLTPDEWRNETGAELSAGESGLRLARPKMSYCAPQADILIRRNGYRFDHVERITTSNQAKLDIAANQVWQLLTFELSQNRYHSKNTLESLDTGLKRGEIRGALDWLTASQRIESRDAPNAGKGGKRHYLHPIASPDKTANQAENTLENEENFASEKTVFGSPPPIGNSLAANLPPPVEPIFSYASPNTDGEPMASLANQSRQVVEVEI